MQYCSKHSCPISFQIYDSATVCPIWFAQQTAQNLVQLTDDTRTRTFRQFLACFVKFRNDVQFMSFSSRLIPNLPQNRGSCERQAIFLSESSRCSRRQCSQSVSSPIFKRLDAGLNFEHWINAVPRPRDGTQKHFSNSQNTIVAKCGRRLGGAALLDGRQVTEALQPFKFHRRVLHPALKSFNPRGRNSVCQKVPTLWLWVGLGTHHEQSCVLRSSFQNTQLLPPGRVGVVWK